MSNICDFERILKTECNLTHLTRNCRIKNLDEFERDEADVYLRSAGLLNDHLLHYGQVFCNASEGRECKCRAVLMKHRRKVKGEQVIILQMNQQLKTKNISHVPGQLFCIDKFLLETDSLN